MVGNDDEPVENGIAVLVHELEDLSRQVAGQLVEHLVDQVLDALRSRTHNGGPARLQGRRMTNTTKGQYCCLK